MISRAISTRQSQHRYTEIFNSECSTVFERTLILPAPSSFTFLLSNFVELYLNSRKRADELILNPCLHTFNFLQHVGCIILKESHLIIIFQTNMWPMISFFYHISIFLVLFWLVLNGIKISKNCRKNIYMYLGNKGRSRFLFN